MAKTTQEKLKKDMCIKEYFQIVYIKTEMVNIIDLDNLLITPITQIEKDASDKEYSCSVVYIVNLIS